MNESDTTPATDPVVSRLRRLGSTPVEPATRSRHLTALAEAQLARPGRVIAGRARVGAALAVGFLLGSTGLASAGALGPLQPAASTALDKVGINVPDGADVGTARIRSAECTALAGADTYKNHGQFLKAVRENGGDLEAAKALDCGKPVASLGDEEEPVEATSDDAGHGRPDSPGASAEHRKDADATDASERGSSDEAPAACAGGADNARAVDGEQVAAQTPPEDAPGMPACAEEQRSGSEAPAGDVPESDGADHGRSAEAPGRASDRAHDDDEETPEAGADQAPAAAESSAGGS